jgi:hypothetical protein
MIEKLKKKIWTHNDINLEKKSLAWVVFYHNMNYIFFESP